MRMTDINVLVYARRTDSPRHRACREFVENLTNGSDTFGLPEATQSGFVRIVTNPRVFNEPTPMGEALRFIETIRAAPAHRAVVPGPRHWQIFSELCLASNARGNLVPDAYLAALAIEANAELATCDNDFARFDGLRWFNPAG